MAILSMARKLTANFSYRVARRRLSLSQPTNRSTTLRCRYRPLSKRCRLWFFGRAITAAMPCRGSQLRQDRGRDTGCIPGVRHGAVRRRWCEWEQPHNASWRPAGSGDAEWMFGMSRARLAPVLTEPSSWMADRSAQRSSYDYSATDSVLRDHQRIRWRVKFSPEGDTRMAHPRCTCRKNRFCVGRTIPIPQQLETATNRKPVPCKDLANLTSVMNNKCCFPLDCSCSG